MSADNYKVTKPDENQSTNQTIDKSRRSFAKAGVVAPIIMTLTSKTVLGATPDCTVSGQLSGPNSSHPNRTTSCTTGNNGASYNAVYWKNCNSEPYLTSWHDISICPISIKIDTQGKKCYQKQSSTFTQETKNPTEYYDPILKKYKTSHSQTKVDATLCKNIGFTTSNSQETVYDGLCASPSDNDPIHYAIVDYLNCVSHRLNSGISKEDIIGAYNVCHNNGSYKGLTPTTALAFLKACYQS